MVAVFTGYCQVSLFSDSRGRPTITLESPLERFAANHSSKPRFSSSHVNKITSFTYDVIMSRLHRFNLAKIFYRAILVFLINVFYVWRGLGKVVHSSQ